MKVIKPPAPIDTFSHKYIVFLAGSIEMGAAEDWQADTEALFTRLPGLILNPRRDDWDSSWDQTLDSPNFVEQVEWELKGLQDANTIMMYFDPNTKAPISLLELGLYARYSGKLRVCCPEGFYRKGNVDVVCREYGVMQFSTLEALRNRISQEARFTAMVSG